ncbi:MAG: sulfotransferase domain-containing protein [Pseudomonadota bacterium]
MKKLDFMILGAQKCGTSALTHFLEQHPDVAMARPKEAHAFDHEDYAGQWTDSSLDEYYGGYFSHLQSETTLGEATPIYLYLADVPAQLRQWQPKLKLIVILRDPVARAWSHYRMARASGLEHLPFWLALLVEPLRLWLNTAPLARHSALRENSYRSRGLYARQLERVFAHFPREQLLVVLSEHLEKNHDATLCRVFDFLGLAADASIEQDRVNQGMPALPPAAVAWLLRLSFVPDLWRLSKLTDIPFGTWLRQR